jgi:hypothetical protein
MSFLPGASPVRDQHIIGGPIDESAAGEVTEATVVRDGRP